MKKLLSYLVLCTFFLFQSCDAQSSHLKVGDKVPSFSLIDQNGKPFSINDYIGKKILIIYFYPKDESGTCTKEACAFRDSYTDFSKAGAMVIGINYASVESHKRFAAHHDLPFVLLSDPGNKVLKMFGVKNMLVLTGRETFMVGLDGKILYTYNSFTDGPAHAQEMLDYINEMKK